MRLPTTKSVLMVLGLVGFAWEAWTIANKEPGDTFSACLKELGQDQPAIPAFCGALMRHLWDDDEKTRAAYHIGWAAGEQWPLKDKREIIKDEIRKEILEKIT